MQRFLKPHELAELDRLLRAKAKWELFPGPQTQAAETEAFETLYGGEAGGGKTELIAYLAKYEHHCSLVLRRSFPELERTLIPRMLERYPDPRYYNQSAHIWRFKRGQRIELGYLDNDKDVLKYQGAEIDGLFPDELTQFPRDWYLYLFSRIRTTKPGQRKRVLATTNPGGENEAWVKERWAAWLDDSHPRPAQSGEVRWFRRVESTADYAEEEVPADHPAVAAGQAWSRTFIRAGIKDNPAISRDYQRNLDMLPEPYRSQLKRGDWNIGSRDSDWQVIPTEWIRMANARWRKRAASWLPPLPDGRMYNDQELSAARPPAEMKATGHGIDVARGGADWTVHVTEYVDFYAWPLKYPGAATPDGFVIVEQLATMSVKHRHTLPDDVPVKIDIVGVGSSPADIAKQNGFNVVGLNGGAGSTAKDKSGLQFANKRAEWYWSLREDLDPNSGAELCLPPHPEVMGDLAAPRYKVLGGKIQVEPKEDIRKRIGRSTDVGDTIVYAHAQEIGEYTGFFEYIRQS